jgi:hypothetical protein
MAYPAGGVAVVYNYRNHSQSRLLAARAGHTINCLSFSTNGTFLALGEVYHLSSLFPLLSSLHFIGVLSIYSVVVLQLSRFGI